MPSSFDHLDLRLLAEAVREARLPEPVARREIRVNAGVSLREMGVVLGVAPMTIQRWETGRVLPRRRNAAMYRYLLDELTESMR